MSSQEDFLSLTGLFLIKNIIPILIVSSIFLLFRFYIAANNIKFEKPKRKVSKVVMIEKMDNLIPSKENILKKVKENLSTPESCQKHKDKKMCLSLGTCVWAQTTDSGNTIEKCLSAEMVDKDKIVGSKGPEDICYCSKEGKLIPWEKYYYLKSGKIVGKNGEKCTAQGDLCKHN